jgi:ribonuclease D
MDFIETDSELIRLCDSLENAAWLAVDTEFERTNTYYPELCLLQIASEKLNAVIDILAIGDTDPIYKLLYRTSITKVFHAARQDLEIFYNIKGKVPVPLFDTQIAAKYLGYDKQLGYANLVQQVLSVELEKTETRTNWKRRPLSQKQLNYAADDVIYLAKLYILFLERLKTSQQASLLTEELKLLTDKELYEPDPQMMWKKIKVAKKLNGEPLERLKRLAAWRELKARQENLPRKWIIGDHALVRIAELCPANLDALIEIKGLDEKFAKNHGNSLLSQLS